MDLHNMSDEELKQLSSDIEREMSARRADRIMQLRDQIRKEAQKLGIHYDDLLEVVAPKKKISKSKVEPKYQNPFNPDESWSGRGRKPTWIVDALNAGMTLDQLKINP
jgi:DNA-binding protein H-NS